MVGQGTQNLPTSADVLGASLARNPFLDEPAPGNLAPPQAMGAFSLPHQEMPHVAAGPSLHPSLPPNINPVASLPQINNTNSSQSTGKAIYAAGASVAAPGGNSIASAFPNAGA